MNLGYLPEGTVASAIHAHPCELNPCDYHDLWTHHIKCALGFCRPEFHLCCHRCSEGRICAVMHKFKQAINPLEYLNLMATHLTVRHKITIPVLNDQLVTAMTEVQSRMELIKKQHNIGKFNLEDLKGPMALPSKIPPTMAAFTLPMTIVTTSPAVASVVSAASVPAYPITTQSAKSVTSATPSTEMANPYAPSASAAVFAMPVDPRASNPFKPAFAVVPTPSPANPPANAQIVARSNRPPLARYAAVAPPKSVHHQSKPCTVTTADGCPYKHLWDNGIPKLFQECKCTVNGVCPAIVRLTTELNTDPKFVPKHMKECHKEEFDKTRTSKVNIAANITTAPMTTAHTIAPTVGPSVAASNYADAKSQQSKDDIKLHATREKILIDAIKPTSVQAGCLFIVGKLPQTILANGVTARLVICGAECLIGKTFCNLHLGVVMHKAETSLDSIRNLMKQMKEMEAALIDTIANGTKP